MTRIRRRLATLAALGLGLAACDVGPAPGTQEETAQSFTYDLTRSNAIDVEAHNASGPIRGVVVSIRAPAVAPDTSGPLLWMGATDAGGHARAVIRTERAGDSLDVTLHKAGWRGPWTDESLRASQGVTAPSSRLLVPLTQAQSLSVDLERTP